VLKKDYEFGPIPDFTSLICVRVFTEKTEKRKLGKVKIRRTPVGFVFVRNPREHGLNALWKAAGGGPEGKETPLETAVRELHEETNIEVQAAECRYEGRWLASSGDHWKCLFSVNLPEERIASMNSKHPGNDGEVPKLFRIDKLLRVVRHHHFMDEHYAKIVDAGLLLPGPAQEAAIEIAA